jgi:hypothetical protein
MQFQDTLEKILRLVGDVKSELGLVRKSTSSEYTKNVEAPVQRRKQFGQRNNDKSEKQRKFANIAIQKPPTRKSHPIPLVGRIVSIVESDDDTDQAAQFAGVVEDTHLDNYRIMTAHNKETVLGSAFSRFQWMDSGEAAIGSKIGTTRFNSMRIDHDITHHNAGQISDINEPLGYYPFNKQALVSKHDDKEMNDMEDEDDYYVRIGKYHPTDISVPGSMEAAERAQERRKLKMEIMRGLANKHRHLLLHPFALLRRHRLRACRFNQSSRRARRRLSTTCRTTWLVRPKGLKIFMLRRGVNRTKTRS